MRAPVPFVDLLGVPPIGPTVGGAWDAVDMDVPVEAVAQAGDIAPSLYGFVTSPGFAGLLAVIAAVIAYIAATGNARRDRWWKRAEYGLDRTLSTDEAEQLVGLAMLRTLRSRNRREQDFIKAATDVFLDPDADGDESDDDPLAVSRRSASSRADPPTPLRVRARTDRATPPRLRALLNRLTRGIRRQ